MLCPNGHTNAVGETSCGRCRTPISGYRQVGSTFTNDPRQHQNPIQTVSGTNGLAVASMVLGIVWIFWIGSLLAFLFGIVAISQMNESGQVGKGMAVSGIVLGAVGGIIFWFLILTGNFHFHININ